MQWFYDGQEEIGLIRGKTWDGKIRRCPIYAWEGYGVVCPTYCTSNGSAELVASVVTGMYHDMHHDLRDTEFSVECIIDGEDWAHRKLSEIRAKLIEKFYQRFPKRDRS